MNANGDGTNATKRGLGSETADCPMVEEASNLSSAFDSLDVQDDKAFKAVAAPPNGVIASNLSDLHGLMDACKCNDGSYHAKRDSGDDDIDVEIWEGLVHVEVVSDSGTSEDEDLTCEFCTPRLDSRRSHSKKKHIHDKSLDLKGRLTLDQLDDDSLYHVAKFLESRSIRFGLSMVCHRFNALFGRGAYYWRVRYTSQMRVKCRCPTIKTPFGFHVADQCLAWDDSQRVWRNSETCANHISMSQSLALPDLGGVDAVHLMNEGHLLVTGDRTRNLNFFDLMRYPGAEVTDAHIKDMNVQTDSTSHKGWIWAVQSWENMVVTGCWDKHIRVFDAEAGCRMAEDYKCTSAILSLHAEENEIVASCFDKRIYFIDRRSSEMTHHVFHSKPVLCVTGNENYIISGSEDKRVSIFDRRAGKMFKGIRLENYPLCVSYSDDQLWLGDKKGMLHLHDGTGGTFKHVGSYDVGHTRKMTGVVNTPGAVFTCSGDKTIKVLEATRNPTEITSFDVHKKEVADIAYSHGVLASGGDDCVNLWLPKHWDRNTYLL